MTKRLRERMVVRKDWLRVLPIEVLRLITVSLTPTAKACTLYDWRPLVSLAGCDRAFYLFLAMEMLKLRCIDWCMMCCDKIAVGPLDEMCGGKLANHSCYLRRVIKERKSKRRTGLCDICCGTRCSKCNLVSCGCVEEHLNACYECGQSFCSECFESLHDPEEDLCDVCYAIRQ
jgi:hypothetical protein